MQAPRGVARGPSRHHYQLGLGTPYIYGLYMRLVLSPKNTAKDDDDHDDPDGFVQVKVCDKLYRDAVNIPYYPEEGQGALMQKKQKKKLRAQFYVYLSAIYKVVAPAYLGSDNYVFQIRRASRLEPFTEGDAARSIVSATSDGLRL